MKPRNRLDETVARLNGRGNGHAENGIPPLDPPPPIPLTPTPEAPEFPMDALPTALRELVEAGSWAMSCPPDFFAVPMLVFAAGAIGNSKHLAITRSHTQPPILWAGVVAPPGTAKSPALDVLRRPFDRLELAQRNDWRLDLEHWQASEKDSRTPKPPTLPRLLVGDVTTESLAPILGENPRGLVLVLDELRALAAAMDQYKAAGKGSDRQAYLSLWSGSTIVIDRKSDRQLGGAPLYVPSPFLSIFGGIQPEVLQDLRGSGAPNDGFLDRFLFSFPSSMPATGEQWREIDERCLGNWYAVVENLLSIKMVPGEHGPRPFYVHLDATGRQAWQTFTDAHAAELNHEDFPDFLRGAWAKLRGYCARLALVVHQLRRSCLELGLAGSLATVPLEVDGWSMACGAELVAYFKRHLEKALGLMGRGGPILTRAVKILECLRRHQEIDAFTRRDLYQHLRKSIPEIDDLDPPLRLLEEHRYLIAVGDDHYRQRGRPSIARYEVNPKWTPRTVHGTRKCEIPEEN